MPDLPTGTVTILYTDIEGSTARWEQQPQAIGAAVARHDTLLRQASAAQRGHVFRTTGAGRGDGGAPASEAGAGAANDHQRA